MNTDKLKQYLPLIVAFSIVIGMFVGIKYQPSGPLFVGSTADDNDYNTVLRYVKEAYVDTVNSDNLSETAINKMLHSLDPFSVYIPKRDLAAVNESLQGNFQGIGIFFYVLNDTVMVEKVIEKGPSERAGLKAGDRIIEVDGVKIAGQKLANDKIVSKLKGPANSSVKVTIYRKSENKMIPTTIKRGTIDVSSLDTWYLLNPETAYIKVNKFSETTGFDFENALKELKSKGAKKLILDLRGNGGGYLSQAIQMCDQFFDSKKLVTYTKDRNNKKDVYFSHNAGVFANGALVVLVDEGTASASEIVSGAIQDHDRGWIIGRRTYGKGLVQQQYELPSGAAVRITVAKYYTPSGRCIQKPYKNGIDENDEELLDRYVNGELYQLDSLKFSDTTQFFTAKGRRIYGGGGVSPDIFVPYDSSSFSRNVLNIISSSAFMDAAFTFADNNRTPFMAYKNADNFVKEFVLPSNVLLNAISKTGVTYQNTAAHNQAIQRQFKALVARAIFHYEGYFRVINQNDPMMNAALKKLNEMKEPFTQIEIQKAVSKG